ncbi:hypothetical protein TL16_g09143 [Triparma laevis f. inornata]|uniref:Helicase ATP-binding domain-containing protein n=1 Tax=Triparma laevis f. inornata TaxID=1714386 RepID=A0A9W7B1G5_9STRA|nr:hypothetical protein TL16_g09143 [Triparma laevis f. inornata]
MLPLHYPSRLPPSPLPTGLPLRNFLKSLINLSRPSSLESNLLTILFAGWPLDLNSCNKVQAYDTLSLADLNVDYRDSTLKSIEVEANEEEEEDLSTMLGAGLDLLDDDSTLTLPLPPNDSPPSPPPTPQLVPITLPTTLPLPTYPNPYDFQPLQPSNLLHSSITLSSLTRHLSKLLTALKSDYNVSKHDVQYYERCMKRVEGRKKKYAVLKVEVEYYKVEEEENEGGEVVSRFLILKEEFKGKIEVLEDYEETKPPPTQIQKHPLYNKYNIKTKNNNKSTKWTGATPSSSLDGLTKGRKSKFNKEALTLSYLSSNSTFTESPETSIVINLDDAKEFLSLKILWGLESKRNLGKMFEYRWREVWEGWEKERYDVEKEVEERLDRKVSKLVKITSLLHRECVERTKSQLPTILTTPNPSKPNPTSNAKFSRRSKKFPDIVKIMSTPQWLEKLESRKKLPIYNKRTSILTTISQNPITILRGSTGCGKSTQLPQYLLENFEGKIIVTQPRRVAAMALADRVEYECTNSELIGHAVRGSSKSGRLVYCTTGVALKMLEEGGLDCKCLVVDEVHERSWQVDLLLNYVRNGERDFKVVLMSATLDLELFGGYFGASTPPIIDVEGRTFPVKHFYLEDIVEESGEMIERDCWVQGEGGMGKYDVRMKVNGVRQSITLDADDGKDVVYRNSNPTNYSKLGYKESTRISMERVDERIINYGLIVRTVESYLTGTSNFKNEVNSSGSGGCHNNGSVLIFLPGVGEIKELSALMEGEQEDSITHK